MSVRGLLTDCSLFFRLIQVLTFVAGTVYACYVSVTLGLHPEALILLGLPAGVKIFRVLAEATWDTAIYNEPTNGGAKND